MSSNPMVSTRPYFIRAVYEWCTDNGFTPYMVVKVDENVQVPLEYVKGDEITLNVSFTSTANMEMENDYIRFEARFTGIAQQVIVPVSHVTAIFARENGQGMGFPAPEETDEEFLKDGRRTLAPRQGTEKPSTLHIVSKEDAGQGGDKTPPTGKKKRPESEKDKKPTLRIVDP